MNWSRRQSLLVIAVCPSLFSAYFRCAFPPVSPFHMVLVLVLAFGFPNRCPLDNFSIEVPSVFYSFSIDVPKISNRTFHNCFIVGLQISSRFLIVHICSTDAPKCFHIFPCSIGFHTFAIDLQLVFHLCSIDVPFVFP